MSDVTNLTEQAIKEAEHNLSLLEEDVRELSVLLKLHKLRMIGSFYYGVGIHNRCGQILFDRASTLNDNQYVRDLATHG
jgi:hypothetical protein